MAPTYQPIKEDMFHSDHEKKGMYEGVHWGVHTAKQIQPRTLPQDSAITVPYTNVLEEYLLNVTETGHWMCRECGKASKKKGIITSHVEETHLAKVLVELGIEVKKPDEVSKDIEDEGKYIASTDNHIQDQNQEVVMCQLCNMALSLENLREHILEEHINNKVIECPFCESKVVTKKALKNHIKQMHLSETSTRSIKSTKSTKSTCNICYKEYTDLYHHVQFKHNKIKNYECSYCKKRFQAKKILFNHVQSVHLGEKTNCPDCKKDISVDNFGRHIKEVHEKIKKPCPKCGKQLSMSGQSRHYKQMHTNDSHDCPKCGQAITASDLAKHIKSIHNRIDKDGNL